LKLRLRASAPGLAPTSPPAGGIADIAVLRLGAGGGTGWAGSGALADADGAADAAAGWTAGFSAAAAVTVSSTAAEAAGSGTAARATGAWPGPAPCESGTPMPGTVADIEEPRSIHRPAPTPAAISRISTARQGTAARLGRPSGRLRPLLPPLSSSLVGGGGALGIARRS
jgi:hypothetical protein